MGAMLHEALKASPAMREWAIWAFNEGIKQ
jgi:hypothetical protein